MYVVNFSKGVESTIECKTHTADSVFNFISKLSFPILSCLLKNFLHVSTTYLQSSWEHALNVVIFYLLPYLI